MKKFRNPWILSLILIISIAGCQNTKTPENSVAGPADTTTTDKTSVGTETPTDALPIADGDVTLTIYCGLAASAGQSMKSLSEHSVTQEVEKITGLKFEFIHPPEGDDGTFFNTTLASGQYPDMFLTDKFNSYPGGAEGAIDDKILLNIDALIEENAPNFLALLEEAGVDEKWIRGDGGAIIKFGSKLLPPFVNGRIHNGFVVRKDWLDKYNLSAPVTIDDYTNVLKVFKENGVEVPLALPKFTETQFINMNIISGAYGVSVNDFQLADDGKTVVYSRTEPGFKDFIVLMNSWANEGYIDRDLISRTVSDVNTLFYNGTAGIAFFHNSNTKSAFSVGSLEDPDYAIEGLMYPRLSADDELHLSRQALSVNQTAWFVSATCKNPVEAVRFIDYLCTEDALLLTAWGLGNDEFPTFTQDEEGNRTFTDFMQNNPNLDYPSARQVYTLDNFQIMYDDQMERQQYNLPENIQIWEAWASGNDNKAKMPHVLSLNLEEAREYASIKSKIDNYADEMVYKLIFGEVPLDELDNFQAQIKALGSERAAEIHQLAYDRYISR